MAPNKPHKKAAKVKAEAPLAAARVADMVRLRLGGMRRVFVCQYVSESERSSQANPWSLAPGEEPMSERNIHRYITRADNVIVEDVGRVSKRMKRRDLARREFLYERAIASNNDEQALAVLKDVAALRNYYPPKRVASTDSKGKDVTAAEFIMIGVVNAAEAPAPV